MDEKERIQKEIAAALRGVAEQINIQRVPPTYCDSCHKRIPETKDIAAKLRDVIEKHYVLCGYIGDEDDESYVEFSILEFPKLLQEFCLFSLYEKECDQNPLPPGRGSMSIDISDRFSEEVARRGIVCEGERAIDASDNDCDDRNLPAHKSYSQERKYKRVSEAWRRRIQEECDKPEVREWLAKNADELKIELVIPENDHIVERYKSPTPSYTPDPRLNIPTWGNDKSAVLMLLNHLYPDSENKKKKKTFLCKYEAVRSKWWGEQLLWNSPLHDMERNAVYKLLFDFRNAGDKILYVEDGPCGKEWLLRTASDTVNWSIKRHIDKHFNLSLAIRTCTREKRPFIGFLAAPNPIALRLADEDSFVKMTKKLLQIWRLNSAFPDNRRTEAIIAKALRLVSLLKLKNIIEIDDPLIKTIVLVTPSSRCTEPGDVAYFLSEHPDMTGETYDAEIHAVLGAIDLALVNAMQIGALLRLGLDSKANYSGLVNA